MMVIKSVAFNTNDPDQAALLYHADKRQNFSAYIKRLIQRDMERWPVVAPEQVKTGKKRGRSGEAILPL